MDKYTDKVDHSNTDPNVGEIYIRIEETDEAINRHISSNSNLKNLIRAIVLIREELIKKASLPEEIIDFLIKGEAWKMDGCPTTEIDIGAIKEATENG